MMDRKYRQRGYMDGDGQDERSRSNAPARKPLTAEERIQRKSLRHAIDREAREVLRCHACGKGISDFGTIGVSSVCPFCDAALHCCRNCSNFDSAARWECRAEIPQPVGDKNKANDCAAYAPRLVLDATGRRSAPAGGGKSGDPRSQFESLFKR
jgi:hypothetical protein